MTNMWQTSIIFARECRSYFARFFPLTGATRLPCQKTKRCAATGAIHGWPIPLSVEMIMKRNTIENERNIRSDTDKYYANHAGIYEADIMIQYLSLCLSARLSI